MASSQFTLPPPDRQIYVHAFLDAARPKVLSGPLKEAVQKLDPGVLSSELQAYAPASGRKILQGTSVRDELVFATPSVLREQPSTLGYFRLLLGVSQKGFYTKSAGLSQFASMEDRGIIRPSLDARIPDLCTALNEAIGLLIQSIPPGTLQADVDQLPIMTLGAQADGSWRNKIGEKATLEVYQALKDVIKNAGYTYVDAGASLTVTNSSGREVTLALAPDPDVEIKERLGAQDFLRAAIEIKGGKDNANIHNRAGEAEKSHQKAKARGAGAFWTIIASSSANMTTLQAESPTTQQWFDLDHVRSGSGADWQKLVSHVRIAMGI